MIQAHRNRQKPLLNALLLILGAIFALLALSPKDTSAAFATSFSDPKPILANDEPIEPPLDAEAVLSDAINRLTERQASAADCLMPNGRKICSPSCGTCAEGECCRGTDMTWVLFFTFLYSLSDDTFCLIPDPGAEEGLLSVAQGVPLSFQSGLAPRTAF
jgi:hypothetical protein